MEPIFFLDLIITQSAEALVFLVTNKQETGIGVFADLSKVISPDSIKEFIRAISEKSVSLDVEELIVKTEMQSLSPYGLKQRILIGLLNLLKIGD